MYLLNPFMIFILASSCTLPTTARATAISTHFQRQQNEGTNPITNFKRDEKTKPENHQRKYFHEPGRDAESGHYDARYFKGKVPYDEHRPALQQLIRSYLTTLRDLGVETWLAHGSLLGWWWNGRIMPWDYDLDVQVSAATLAFLGERYNRSTHQYYYYDDGKGNDDAVLFSYFDDEADLGGRGVEAGESTEDKNEKRTMKKKKKKTYLLDVNPHHGDLTKGNGANIIDARWIDMSNGMFVDITGLRERDVEHSSSSGSAIWSCKNNHRYRTAELWPLRRTRFEGVEAWIPYDFDKVLTDEYGPKCLVNTEWAGHQWKPELKEWVKNPEKQQPMDKKKGNEKVVVYKQVVVEV